jgi:hypothetical protein
VTDSYRNSFTLQFRVYVNFKEHSWVKSNEYSRKLFSAMLK